MRAYVFQHFSSHIYVRICIFSNNLYIYICTHIYICVHLPRVKTFLWMNVRDVVGSDYDLVEEMWGGGINLNPVKRTGA